MELELDGIPAIVTGASRGIGRAVAVRLAREGARVLVVARRAQDAAEAADEVGGEWVAEDVTDAGAAERIVSACAERLGEVRVLVNNAGTMGQTGLDELTDADWQEQWELNVMGPMRLMRAAAPLMAAAGGGRIVNVASSAGKRPTVANAAYSVTKAAQLSLSRVFADVWSPRGVHVNAVTPGPTLSPLWVAAGGLADQAAAARGVPRDELLRERAEALPRRRLAEPEEIADVVAFLCSERAANVTGAAWSVDGGSVPGFL